MCVKQRSKIHCSIIIIDRRTSNYCIFSMVSSLYETFGTEQKVTANSDNLLNIVHDACDT